MQPDPSRIRIVNDAPVRSDGAYVLYWMQMYRRLDHNHALDHALACARTESKPLVIYEGLKLGYPWASQRLHTFILQGMLANLDQANRLGLNYWPFVETADDSGRGLLRSLAKNATRVVTDDFPCFIIPDQTAALAAKTDTRVEAVDSNSIVPLAELGSPVVSAAQLRRRIHKAFAKAWTQRPATRLQLSKIVCEKIDAPFQTWQCDDLDKFVRGLPLDATVGPVANRPGGSAAAKKCLREFVRNRLKGYAEGRSQPSSPDDGHGSGLSPYLHFGHIAVEEVVAEVLATIDGWNVSALGQPGKREGFYADDADVSSFLDEAITWRDVGMNWHWSRRQDTESLEKALPDWAKKTLHKHAADRRDPEYSLEELEAGKTHDPLWNAAQKELIATGSIHNYLRMLWGKKVLQWSPTPDEAYSRLVHLNNKYALDGRNPNSYSGILWCFGLFDRPWGPERPIFGSVRYMSSENTARKFKLQGYYDYVATLNG